MEHFREGLDRFLDAGVVLAGDLMLEFKLVHRGEGVDRHGVHFWIQVLLVPQEKSDGVGSKVLSVFYPLREEVK